MSNLLQNIFESILFFILMLGLNYFVYYGVLFHFGIYWPYILLISMIIAVMFPFSQLIERRKPNSISRLIYVISSVILGFTFYLLFLIIALLVVEAFIALPEPLTTILILLFTLCITAYSIFSALNIKEKVVKLSFNELKSPLRIAHISDVHVGSINTISFLKKLVSRLNNINVDLVVITGDLGDGSRLIKKDSFEPFKDLNMPIYFVTGNHDAYSGLNNIYAALNNANVIILNDKLESFREDVEIIGINFSMGDQFKEILNEFPPNKDKFSILLHHLPTGWDISRKNNVNLQLAGHTHAGQFYPMNFIVKLVFPYLKGLFQEGDDYLYVSAGTGTWGPPLRSGSSSEIIVFELEPKK